MTNGFLLFWHDYTLVYLCLYILKNYFQNFYLLIIIKVIGSLIIGSYLID